MCASGCCPVGAPGCPRFWRFEVLLKNSKVLDGSIQPQSVMLPPLCLTLGTLFLGWNASPLRRLVAKLFSRSPFLFPCDHAALEGISFNAGASFFSLLGPLSPKWCKSLLTLISVLAAFSSWQGCALLFLNIWTHFLSAEGDSLVFHPDLGEHSL